MFVFQWVKEGTTEASKNQQAEDGKTELSLMHFTVRQTLFVFVGSKFLKLCRSSAFYNDLCFQVTNPEWKPPEVSNVFINELKEHGMNSFLVFF